MASLAPHSQAPEAVPGLGELLALAHRDGPIEEVFAKIAELCVSSAGFAAADVLRADGAETWSHCASAGELSDDADAIRSATVSLAPGHVARRALEKATAQWASDKLAIPLLVDGRGWGAVVITRQSGIAVAANPTERAHAIAGVGALVIGYKETQARLSVAGATDSLTGLPHERYFIEQLEREMARAIRGGTALAIAVLEIDRFRSLFEESGALVADRLFADVGRLLDGLARSDEVVARLDGDAFGWILAGADQANSTIAAQRALTVVAGADELQVPEVSLSIGICDIAYANDSRGMVRRASEALEWAKVMGRGMIAHYSHEGPISSSGTGIIDIRRRMGSTKSRAPIAALLRTLEAVDPAASRHSERVGELAAQIALEMGWSETLIGAIRDAGCLHDIGMLCIPDEILKKPGALTESEFARVKQHTELGADMAGKIIMPAQAAWIRGHHERWDGAGYPEGLAGGQIPEGAAIVGLADAWDSMTAARTYAALRSKDEALAEIRGGAGSQFSPAAVEALERLLDAGGGNPTAELPAPGADMTGTVASGEADRSQE